MSTLPLIAHDRPDVVLAWRDGVPVRVRQMQRIAPDVFCRIDQYSWRRPAGGGPTAS